MRQFGRLADHGRIMIMDWIAGGVKGTPKAGRQDRGGDRSTVGKFEHDRAMSSSRPTAIRGARDLINLPSDT